MQTNLCELSARETEFVAGGSTWADGIACASMDVAAAASVASMQIEVLIPVLIGIGGACGSFGSQMANNAAHGRGWCDDG